MERHCLLPLFWTLLTFACSVTSSPPGGPDDTTSRDGGGDTEDASIEGQDEMATDEGGPLEPDIPLTCEGVLTQGQCLIDEMCPSWAQCLGPGTCTEPPCWGLCEDYPGACLPKVSPRLCLSNGDCEAGEVCAGPSIGASEKRGLCVTKPAEDACFEDRDCPSGKVCAGEVLCTPDRPCLGPPFFGRCRDKPPEGGCWDERDCKPGERCRGSFICGFTTTCDPASEHPGTCSNEGCFSDEDCKGSKEGPFCVGAYVCPPSKTCSLEDTPGFCAKAPGFKRCWEQEDCSEGLCRSALVCPEGTPCAQGLEHPGLCGEVLEKDIGLQVVITPQKPVVKEPFTVTLLNLGPALLFVPPCDTLIIKFSDPDLGWISWFEPADHPFCRLDQPQPLAVIPPSSGVSFDFVVDVPGTYRVELSYRLGCPYGLLEPAVSCATGNLTFYSEEFEVVNAPPPRPAFPYP